VPGTKDTAILPMLSAADSNSSWDLPDQLSDNIPGVSGELDDDEDYPNIALD
jgi:hypothetical protein